VDGLAVILLGSCYGLPGIYHSLVCAVREVAGSAEALGDDGRGVRHDSLVNALAQVADARDDCPGGIAQGR
jgi:hypothetical protein